jgi:hypothetical protein
VRTITVWFVGQVTFRKTAFAVAFCQFKRDKGKFGFACDQLGTRMVQSDKFMTKTKCFFVNGN